MSVTVSNSGAGSAGPFTVKVWISGSPVIDSNAVLLYTWSVPGLSAGQSISNTFNNLVANGLIVHADYYLITKADADNQITETTKADNISYRDFFVFR